MTTAGIVIAMALAAILVLALIWWRRHPHPETVDAPHPGQGIADEMAAAVEDVATRFSKQPKETGTTSAPADTNVHPRT